MDKTKIKTAIDQLKYVHRGMEDCPNRFILNDAINQIEEAMKKDCTTCKHIEVSKFITPCYGCRDNDKFDHWEPRQ